MFVIVAGYESAKWLGKCPACNEWNTFFEQKLDTKIVENKRQGKENQEPIKLKDVTSKEILRMSTGFAELDRVLGRWLSRRLAYFAWAVNRGIRKVYSNSSNL